ncbi:MAG: type II secretion system F family protein [Candidatus Thermoplasmatota archaeon]|jgi:flagellar protein FlaJ|nr:type II secretion system F family protein [Candidatus Thermoplasmatota archaeon]
MKYDFLGLELKYLALTGSSVVTAIFIIIVYFGHLPIDYLSILSVSLVVIMIPFGLADFAEVKRKENAEKRLPDFLRDLAGHTNFGTPMSEAILRSAEVNYGPLSEEVEHVAGMIKLGIPVEIALEDFGSMIKSDTIKKVGAIIKKASQSGSNTSDVISIISSFTTQTYLMRESRFADMRSFSTTLSVSFGVFLFVIIMLDLFFFPQIASQTGGGSTGTLNISSGSFQLIEKIFSLGIVVQSVASGLISGVFRDGRLVSGSLISGILVIVSIVVLSVVGVM